MVLLKEARNVKYADFVAPGQVLHVTAEIKQQDARETRLMALGSVDGIPTVSARVVMERFNLADTDPVEAATDEQLKREMRQVLGLLWDGEPASAAQTHGGEEDRLSAADRAGTPAAGG
jgi:3-hydroxyacyl-[acyl-carrier-protein] dehydratase